MHRSGPAVLRWRDEAHRAPVLATFVALRDRRVRSSASCSSSPPIDLLLSAGSPRSPAARARLRAGSRHCWLVECSAGGRAPLIDRYALPEIAGLFTDEARFQDWLEVEILASEAWAKLGVVPAADAAAIRERAGFTVEAIRAREAVTDHETAAFVDVVQEAIGGPAAKWVHYGLTSYDVVDTAMSMALVRACDLIIEAVDALEAAVVARAVEHRDTPMAGRTHGIHAEPITFGSKVALWALQLRRDPCAAHPGPRGGGDRQALGRGRQLLQRRSRGRGLRLRAPRAPTRPVDPGPRPRRGRGVAVRVRGARLVDRGVRVGGATPATHRGARGGGTLRHRRAEGLERDAAQAESVAVGAAVWSRPGVARQPAGGAGERRAVARARHVALVGRTHRAHRLPRARLLHGGAVPGDRGRHGRARRPHAREPRGVARPRVQRVGDARARRVGAPA